MTDKKKQAVVVVGLLSAFICAGEFGYVDATDVPQSEVSEAVEDTHLAITKYTFMLNAKDAAAREYAEMLLNAEPAVEAGEDAAMQELEARIAMKAASNREHKYGTAVESVSDDVAKLAEAVAKLEELNLSIEKNDVEVVTSSAEKKPLLKGNRVDENYHGQAISITGSNRQTLEHLVMGEAGDQGYKGAALVAQAIRDTMVLEGVYDVATIKREYQYSGGLDNTPNQDVKDAVAFIFDEGGMAVQHRILYFYAPGVVSSRWHESQKFIVTYKGHRFFDRW